MAASGGAKTWFTAAELAELKLPGLPKTKRKINELAADRRWGAQVDAAGIPLARPRAGRGGGLAYSVALLPPAASADLIRRGLLQPEPAAVADTVVDLDSFRPPAAPDQLWSWFERQPAKVQADARRRLQAVQAVEAMEAGGHTRTAAVASAAAAQDVSVATLWNWLGFITGVAASDRLPRLAPRRQGGGCEAEIDAKAWLLFKSDYLRPEQPSLASCYGRLLTYAEPLGLAIPHAKTLQRRLEREVDSRVIIAKREGAEALRRILPPQERTVSDLHALELVNIDGHKWDVFVRWPDGHVGRPMMVAIQDIYSRKFLAWRIGQTESTVLTRLAFADLFKTWGIPGGCLLDNGRAFASKAITGGAKTRFRFKILPEDPTGLLTSLNIDIHWATPYRGQSKPIERGFRDLCDHGAKHPAFAGAYTGNKPDAKPENYGEKAIDLAVFIRVVGQVMAAHNAKLGRRTEMARGGSFDQAFADSYARSPIRRATPEQQRLALLAAEKVSTDRLSGAISLYDNRFWTEELHAVAGQRVVVRFDPDDLASEVHVYTMDNVFIATAPVIAATGFLNVEAAKTRARQEAELRRATRRATELEDLMSAEDVAALLPDDEPEDEIDAPTVIRPVRMRATAGAARRPAIIDRLNFEDLAPASEPRAPLRLVE